MLHHRDDSGSAVWAEWHRERARYFTEIDSLDLVDSRTIEKYDLDTPDGFLDGRAVPRNFLPVPYGDVQGTTDNNPRDIRKSDRR